jgi:hypothetical protein
MTSFTVEKSLIRHWHIVNITDVCGILGLTVGKFSHGGWSWNEADNADLLLAFLD